MGHLSIVGDKVPNGDVISVSYKLYREVDGAKVIGVQREQIKREYASLCSPCVGGDKGRQVSTTLHLLRPVTLELVISLQMVRGTCSCGHFACSQNKITVLKAELKSRKEILALQFFLSR